jgi:MFS family permease
MYPVANNAYILVLSFIFQMLGGIGNGICTTSTLAIISSYKENRQLYIGYFEIASGLGTLLGPIIGTVFYTIGGYQAPFFGIASIYLLIVIVARVNMKNIGLSKDVNLLEEALTDRGEGSQVDHKTALKLSDILKVVRSLFGLIL